MTKREGHVQWIDNAKMLSIFAVISFHFWLFFHPDRQEHFLRLFSSWRTFLELPFELGWQGDFVFFATSGLGLAYLVARKKPSWSSFYQKRIIRIYIPYWVTVVAMLVYQYISIRNGNWDIPLVIPQGISGWGYNIFLIGKPGLNYFSSHFWFLFDLVQMYVLFPLLYKMAKTTKWFGVIIMIAVHILYRQFSGTIPLAGYLTVLVWIVPFYYGIFIGIEMVRNRERTEQWLHRLFPLGVVIWAVGSYLTDTPSGQNYANPLTSAGLLIILFKLSSLSWNLSWLNKVSYEVYLVHLPFTGFYRHFFGFVTGPKIVIYPFFVVTSFLMSYIIHYLTQIVLGLPTFIKDNRVMNWMKAA